MRQKLKRRTRSASQFPQSAVLVPADDIERRIFSLRGHKAMIDSDLAEVYGVGTRALNQAVRRNRHRFPRDFMIRLTLKETDSLRSQSVISKTGRAAVAVSRTFSLSTVR